MKKQVCSKNRELGGLGHLETFVAVVQLKSYPTLCDPMHGLQYARLSCPALCPGVCSDSCPLSQWCHPTTSSAITSFSSCPQCFPASGSFPMSRLWRLGAHLKSGSATTQLPWLLSDLPILQDKAIYWFLEIIYCWLRWVIVAACSLSPAAASGGHSAVVVCRLLLRWSAGTRARRLQQCSLRCPATCETFPDQGSNPWIPALASGFPTSGHLETWLLFLGKNALFLPQT